MDVKENNLKNNILISACLLGSPVRYNGTDLLLDHPLIKKWKDENRLISICPEVAGGMSVPRTPAEIKEGDGFSVLSGKAQVFDQNNNNVSSEFILGAQQALLAAQDNHCIAAILTERSPSCGSQIIYDGSFNGNRIEGLGVTTALLQQNGIEVFSQYQLTELEIFLNDIS